MSPPGTHYTGAKDLAVHMRRTQIPAVRFPAFSLEPVFRQKYGCVPHAGYTSRTGV